MDFGVQFLKKYNIAWVLLEYKIVTSNSSQMKDIEVWCKIA